MRSQQKPSAGIWCLVVGFSLPVNPMKRIHTKKFIFSFMKSMRYITGKEILERLGIQLHHRLSKFDRSVFLISKSISYFFWHLYGIIFDFKVCSHSPKHSYVVVFVAKPLVKKFASFL